MLINYCAVNEGDLSQPETAVSSLSFRIEQKYSFTTKYNSVHQEKKALHNVFWMHFSDRRYTVEIHKTGPVTRNLRENDPS